MGKKGKKKGDGSGDQKPQPPEGVQVPQQGPSGQSPAQPPAQEPELRRPQTVEVTQPETQQTQQGQGKKKKGKQQQQPQQPTAEVPKLQEGPQPADVGAGALPQTQGKRKGKQQQQQQQQPQAAQQQQQQQQQQPQAAQQQQQQSAWGQRTQQPQAGGPPPGIQQPQQWAPLPQAAPPQQSAWGQRTQQPQPSFGRGQPQQGVGRGQQQQQPGGRGQQQPGGRGQQQPGGRGQQPRGQTPPQQHQVSPPPQQQQQPQPGGRGQQPQVSAPPPQQQQQPQPGGRGQQPGGRGQQPQVSAPPQQQQQQQQPQPGGRGQGGRGGRGAPSTREPPSDIQQLQGGVQKIQLGAGDYQRPRPAAGSEFELAKRSDVRRGGTQGRPLHVLTNHLELKIKPKFDTAIHYDVTIEPDKPKRMMRTVWEEFRRQYLSKVAIAFDDTKNAYSPVRFPDVSGQVQAAEDGPPKPYSVTVKMAGEVNLAALFSYMQSGCKLAIPQDALQCIDIVLRNASALAFTRVGRSFFSEPRGERIVKLGDGLELWHGFFQSAVIGWKPFLNVDVAHKGFPTEQPVIDLFEELSKSGYNRPPELDIEKANKFLKSLKVEYSFPRPAVKKVFRVNSCVQPPERATFVHDDRSMTVFDYFKNVRKYTIKYPQYPCLWVGSKDKKVYLPPELCKIVKGQVCNRKLNEIQTSNMVRNAATNTDTRKAKTMDMVHRVNLNNDPVVRAFGIEIGHEFEKINARQLQPPELEYGKQNKVRPMRGTWRAAEFLIPQHIPEAKWTIICIDRRTRDDDLTMFARTMCQEGGKLGMRVGKPIMPFERIERFIPRHFEDVLKRYKDCSIVFVIVSDYPANVYSKVKQLAELHVGLLTQCIKSRTISRMSPATATNIMLKVNAKLNGKNHKIADISRPLCLARPCMIMGADVTHPSPDQNDIPSVAAVTASYDATAFRYNFCWRLQSARQEIIEDLENIVQEQLTAFYQSTRHWPERIIFFRDGVSEGQFREVMNMEVQAIKRACSRMGTPDTFKPPITFVVVQKRHHTRFFPSNPQETDDRNCNVRAGTVVDTHITHPTALEYYLVSHASIQGVARPTKYRVLYDEKNMTEDELESLTYYLCHMFSRCTRSVSYPAPTYYAHLAAFRARHYLEGDRVNLDNLEHEQNLRNIKPKVKDGMPMFFV